MGMIDCELKCKDKIWIIILFKHELFLDGVGILD